jgi:hypothetical protein
MPKWYYLQDQSYRPYHAFFRRELLEDELDAACFPLSFEVCRFACLFRLLSSSAACRLASASSASICNCSAG